MGLSVEEINLRLNAARPWAPMGKSIADIADRHLADFASVNGELCGCPDGTAGLGVPRYLQTNCNMVSFTISKVDII